MYRDKTTPFVPDIGMSMQHSNALAVPRLSALLLLNKKGGTKNSGSMWIRTPTHYLQNVRILINHVGDTEIKKLYPILHETFLLRHICLYAPKFPQCTIGAEMR